MEGEQEVLLEKACKYFLAWEENRSRPEGGGNAQKEAPPSSTRLPPWGWGGHATVPGPHGWDLAPPPPPPGCSVPAPQDGPPHTPPQAGPVGVFTSHSARPGLHRLGKGTRGFLGSDGGRGVSVSCVGVCVPSPPPTPTQPKASTAPLGIHHRKRGARAVGIYLLPPLAPCILPPVAEGN